MVIHASRCQPRHRAPRGPGRTRDSRQELARLYTEHAGTLLKLATLLVRDTVAAREVLYQAFTAMEQTLSRQRSVDALPFLLRDVVDRTRIIMTRDGAYPGRGRSGTGSAAFGRPGGLGRPGDFGRSDTSGDAGSSSPDRFSSPDAVVLDLLRALPGRQREALVLRYYGQFSDDEVAAAMGITRAELRANVVRGMAALQLALGSPLPAK
ncbi:MAG TPA: sigma factor-like helix-turn-helix DNA-binding protein [Trebonia sp.]|jgi:DNA-directed RNA polymerase specialized sigma24 family protein